MKLEKEFYTKINGSTFCNGQDIIKTLKKGQELFLVPEPNNKYDNHAIMVCTESAQQVGYIPKATAWSITEELKDGFKARALVSEITGGSQGKDNVGCNLSIYMWKEEEK